MKLVPSFIFLVLLLNIKDIFIAGFHISECCFNKEVGNYRYVLINEEDTSGFGCESNCVYKKDSEPDSRYCFKAGFEPFYCVSEHAPIVSSFSISEDNEELVQRNSFQNETGVLELIVPPHKDYTESVFMLHQDSNTAMVKTNNSCQLSDLPEDLNVSEMAENYEVNDKRRVGESDKVTSFILKIREARYGSLKRKKLIPDVQYLCKGTSLVKTNDVPVNETEFEKYNRGEVIFLKNKRSSRYCVTETACSDKGPKACGYGWTNPDPDASVKGFSFHQVSSGSVCVSCDIYTDIAGTAPCDSEFCLCKDITNKEELQICSVKSGLNTTIQLKKLGINRNKRSPMLLVQTMLFNKKTSALSLIISSPAHQDIGGLEVVMHARQDGYWHASNLKNNRMLKLGGVCHIATLPPQVFPVDIAIGMQEIKAGNNVTNEDDEEERNDILLDAGPLEAGEEGNLHPDIKSRCLGSPIKKFVEAPITKSQGEDLKKGEIIFVKSGGSRSGNCQLETAATSYNSTLGCWRWPNPDGDNLWIHNIVHSVVHVTCCRNLLPDTFPTCCADNHWEYCACEDITRETFNQCRDPKALFVATGVTGTSPSSSAEVLTEGMGGTYTSKNINIVGCSEIPNFPTVTSSATGGLFNGVPHICSPSKSDSEGRCYGFETDGSWKNGFNLINSQNSWVSSVVFRNWKEHDSAWWIVGDSGTEVWAGKNPEEVSNDGIKLPTEINKPCMTKISDHEAFVTATPKFVPSATNFAWIYNIQSNSWSRLPDTLEKRSGPACGYLKKGSARFVVLAGGLSSSTSEILNLDTHTWTTGPTIGTKLFGSSMVSVHDDTEVLLVGGFNGEAASPNILRMNSSMISWNTIAGQLTPPRFNAIALAVPFDSLPPLCSV